MPDASTYPFFFTWGAQAQARPLHLVGGEGVRFRTRDGATWLDMGSLTYQASLGHGHRRLIEAVRRQASELCLVTPQTVYPAKEALAERLLALAPPGYTKVFFTLGGAEAVENALKIARMVTGRYKLISRYRSYHGATMGALTLSGDYRRAPLEPGLTGVVHALECYLEQYPVEAGAGVVRGRAEHIPEILAREGPVAAVILEPVPGANGVLVPPPGYWAGVREACDRHGALLVADEVLNGFGRTGRWFGFEHFDGVVPDMITVSKALTGGYAPLGAVLVHERVASHFEERPLLAGLTFYAHPLGCAAALEALAVYEDEGLVERAAALAPRLVEGMRALARGREAVRAVRVIGLLGALELGGLTGEAWGRLMGALEARRVYLHARQDEQTLILSPPLCIDEAALDDGLERVDAALREALGP